VVDVLLTENEEMCMSTAQYFEAEKQYNWMFSFDRMGDDVVTYQYDNANMKQLLMSYGFDVGFGSYSDIVELDHLGCWGMNIGCGMHDYHSQKAYADIKELADQVDKFTQFYWDNKEIHFGYERPQRHARRVTHPHGWDEEWDEGFWYETKSYVPGEAAIRYISDRYADDKY